MFAVVRTGGKQYRVAAEDKITVERLAGEIGDTIHLGDVLAIGEGGDLKDVAGQVVSAEIVAQPKGDKVIVFKKKRRQGYRRKNGHRQLLTVLKITAIGKAEAKPAKAKPAAKVEEPKVEAKPAKAVEAKAEPKKETAPKAAKPAAEKKAAAKPAAEKKASAKKAAPAKAAPKKPAK